MMKLVQEKRLKRLLTVSLTMLFSTMLILIAYVTSFYFIPQTVPALAHEGEQLEEPHEKPETNWGEGLKWETPTPSSSEAASSQSVRSDPASIATMDRVVYLTFDDGPSPYTGRVLDTLDKYGIKATFFVMYRTDAASLNTYKQIVSRGHSIGVHGLNHNYTRIYASTEIYMADFLATRDQIKAATGVDTRIFRFPGGSVSKYTRDVFPAMTAAFREGGFIYYDWNVSSGDGSSASTSDLVYNYVVAGVAARQYSIVLMHDTKVNTVNALPDVLNKLKSIGCKFAKLTPDIKPVQFAYKP